MPEKEKEKEREKEKAFAGPWRRFYIFQRTLSMVCQLPTSYFLLYCFFFLFLLFFSFCSFFYFLSSLGSYVT